MKNKILLLVMMIIGLTFTACSYPSDDYLPEVESVEEESNVTDTAALSFHVDDVEVDAVVYSDATYTISAGSNYYMSVLNINSDIDYNNEVDNNEVDNNEVESVGIKDSKALSYEVHCMIVKSNYARTVFYHYSMISPSGSFKNIAV